MSKTFSLAVVGPFLGLSLCAADASAVLADFSGSSDWRPAHNATAVRKSAEGLAIAVTGDDPWVLSPALRFPVAPVGARRVRVTLTCAPVTYKGEWQLFYSFGGRPYSEGASCFLKPVGAPPYTQYAAELSLDEIGSGDCSLRLDPPDVCDTWTMKSLTCDFMRPIWTPPATSVPPSALSAATPLVLRGAGWELRHDPDRLGAFRFASRQKTVENLPAEPFVLSDRTSSARTLEWASAKMTVRQAAGSLETSARLADADGVVWTLTRRFSTVEDGRALAIATEIACSETSRILHLPFLTLLADRCSEGRKHQALLAGVEYLADEPSSNKKEIRTLEHNRLIPADWRLAAPLAVLTDRRNWLAARWTPNVTATVFDTPDRLFSSGGHLLGFWLPAVGSARRESERDIYEPTAFRSAVQTVVLRTGPGATVAEALEGVLPPHPATLPPPDAVEAVPSLETLARGWLDSAIRSGSEVRHAVPFQWTRATDAPVLMRYLAAELERRPGTDPSLVPRLRKAADEMLGSQPKTSVGWTGVSHVRRPAPVLVAGDVTNWLARTDVRHRELNRTLADGRRTWKASEQGGDFGSTLGDDHCNGYTAMELVELVSAAVWSGDEAEIGRTLAIVDRATERYHGTVPRGAQPWEMPLHTPDIVAAARLTKAYALAALLSGETRHSLEARHWAYSGLAFVYLAVPPVAEGRGSDPVGRYATCGVMGATNWEQPNWIGRPVQWCGLVYADALWDLARLTSGDETAFWRKLAVGITASGVRQTHPADEPELVGLLPDSWNLTEQTRYPVPINPGTVQENYAESLGRPYYSLVRLAHGTLLHLPGSAERLGGSPCACRIEGWPDRPFSAVLTRMDASQKVTLDGRPLVSSYDAARRVLIVRLPARAAGVLAVATNML